jgi:hypothetical protein
MPSDKEKEFRKVYGELTDEELEAYGGMIFRQIKEAEDKKEKEDGQASEGNEEKQVP